MNSTKKKHDQEIPENTLMLQTEQQRVETTDTTAPHRDNQSRNSRPKRITHWSEEDIFDSDYPD